MYDIRPFFCYFKHEIRLFKVLLSLKVVKFDTKIYFNFFRGRILAGGTSLGPKTGTSVGWEGGLTKFLPPPSPSTRKKTLEAVGPSLSKFLKVRPGGTPYLKRQRCRPTSSMFKVGVIWDIVHSQK